MGTIGTSDNERKHKDKQLLVNMPIVSLQFARTGHSVCADLEVTLRAPERPRPSRHCRSTTGQAPQSRRSVSANWDAMCKLGCNVQGAN